MGSLARTAFTLGGTALLLSGCLARYTFPQLVREPVNQPTTPIVFRDVRVFAATSTTAQEHQDVIVEGGAIRAVTPHGGPLPENARIIEGAGKTLMPGYVDAHAHLTGSPAPPWKPAWPDVDHNGRAALASGITNVQDVGGDLDALVELSKRTDWLGPRFWYSGPIITPTGGYPASMVRELFSWPVSRIAESRFATQVASAAEANEAVDARVAAGAHHLKVAVAQVPAGSPVYDVDLLRAVVTRAHGHHRKVVAHIDTAEHALLAARAGVDALVHSVHVGALTRAQANELKQLGTVVAPTLVVFDRIDQLGQSRFTTTPAERALYPADFLAAFAPEVTRSETLPDGLMSWIRTVGQDKPKRLEAVANLVAAGVPLLVGSDAAGSIGCLSGGAFLDDLRLMVEAGVPNAEVLLGATSRAADFMLGDAADFGTVVVGKRADLVLLDGNPLDDISATSRIVQVMKGGVLLERLP